MRIGAKRPFTDADLMAYSHEHLWYEVWMFFEIVAILSKSPATASASSHVTFATTGSASTPPSGVPNSIAPPPGAGPTTPIVENNVYIEAFMTHLRNLIEFLFNTTPDQTDVAALDFYVPGTWRNPAPTPALADAKKRANKELAHLTSGRVSGSPVRKQWPVVALAQELRTFLRNFIATADAKKLSPRIASLL